MDPSRRLGFYTERKVLRRPDFTFQIYMPNKNFCIAPRRFLPLVILTLLAGLSACQIFPTPTSQVEIQDTLSPEELGSLPAEFVSIQGQSIRQWAISAEASSEYAVPEWAAEQATGSPNTQRCGDYQTAWATAGSDSVDWLTLKFPLPVHVVAINIIQSFNPDQVVKVELIGPFERATEVFVQEPRQVDQSCPYTLSIPVDRTEGRFDTIRITLDQSVLGLGWNQIDAVELVGEP